MSKLLHWITSHLFRRVSLGEVMARELADAELQLLAAESAREFATSAVSMNQARIARLKNKLVELGEKQEPKP